MTLSNRRRRRDPRSAYRYSADEQVKDNQRAGKAEFLPFNAPPH